MVVTRKSKSPNFKTGDEERAFWVTHGALEFVGELEELDVAIRRAPRRPRHAI